jgi:molybdopterin molybdotransferase
MSETSASVVLGYEEAAAAVRAHAAKVEAHGAEEVALLESTGRVAAEAVAADREYPPFARSTRDGFACRAADLRGGMMRVVGQLRAGEAWKGGRIGAGEAVEIMTGAGVPEGADAVVMVEHVRMENGQISFAEGRTLAAGENIVPAGAEARAGDVLVPAGRRMGPAEIAAAASCGYARLKVSARPRVAILATGDELVGVGEKPQAQQIRNSNSYSLATEVTAAGGTPVIFPVVRDAAEATERAIEKATACDLVLLTGGVSMGKFDFVEQALGALGADFFFTGARIQPGKPVVFGKLPGPYFFGLPGNPISTMVTFALFAATMVRALAGESEAGPRFVSARLEADVRVKPGLTRFLPARMTGDVHGAQVRRIEWQGSGDLAAAARANGFVVVPETTDSLKSGEAVAVLML